MVAFFCSYLLRRKTLKLSILLEHLIKLFGEFLKAVVMLVYSRTMSNFRLFKRFKISANPNIIKAENRADRKVTPA